MPTPIRFTIFATKSIKTIQSNHIMNHLYRNLLLLCVLSLGLFSSCQEPDAIVPADSEEIANSPVSYTHLDVYKRQKKRYERL